MSDKLPYDRFDALVDRNRDVIKVFCVQHSGGEASLASELEQECLISVWRHINSVPKDATAGDERRWVVWQCRSAVSHHFRQRKLARELRLQDGHFHITADEEPAYRQAIDELRSMLSPQNRHPFDLMADGYSTAEMARELGIRHSSAAQLRYRIVRFLRDRYGLTAQTRKQNNKNNK